MVPFGEGKCQYLNFIVGRLWQLKNGFDTGGKKGHNPYFELESENLRRRGAGVKKEK